MANKLGMHELEVYESNNIFASLHPAKEYGGVVVAQGQGVLPRGTIVGKKAVSLIDSITVTAGSSNTGNGTLTLGTNTLAAGLQAGDYVVTVASGATTFTVKDPKNQTVGSGGSIGSAFNDEIKFTITQGETAFVQGDVFTITVVISEGNDFYYIWNSEASDGTQNIVGILGETVDTTSDDAKNYIYVSGEFNRDALFAGTNVEVPAGVFNSGSIVIKEVTE